MANVRCPMCSKLNPPEAEVCSYCGARIKPLRLNEGGSTASVVPGAVPSKNDEPDWLKDLRTGSPGGGLAEDNTPDQSAAPGGEADVPDWLSRIRDRARTETSPSSDLFGEDKEPEADWMSGMQAENASDQGLDDWLKRLPGAETTETGKTPPPVQAQPQAGAPEAQPPAGEAPAFNIDDADWLRGLPGDTQPGSEPAAPFDTGNPAGFPEGFPEGASAGASADTTAGEEDWMSKLSAWQAGFTEDERDSTLSASAASGSTQQPVEKEQPSEGEGLPDIFGKDSGFDWAAPETRPAHEAPSSGFGLTGFLSQIERSGEIEGSGENEGSGVQPEETPAAGAQSEDIFSAWDQPAAAAPQEEPLSASPGEAPQEMPGGFDWLKGLEAESAAQEPPAFPMPPAGETPTGSGMPAWLQETASEAAPEPAAPFETGPSGLPSWLSGEAETPAQPTEQPFMLPQDQPQAEKTDLPAWLFADEAAVGQAPAEGEAPAETAQEAPAVGQVPAFTGDVQPGAPAEGVPDWMSGSFAAAAPETPAVTPAAAEGELPDWFASFDQKEIEKTQPSRVTGGLKPLSAELPGMPPAAEEPAAAIPPAGEAAPAEEAEGPDWLREFNSTPEETTASVSPLLSSAKALDSAAREGDQPFTVDLPEWLGEEETAAQPEAQTGGPVAETTGEPLAQADLPDWVRNMRPLESILPGEAPTGESDQRVEKAGPLAGMRGVLPVEDMATRYRKPPIYSIKLHVTEKQRTQATLLESILTQESQSLLIPPERSHGTGVLMRVLLALFLLVALAFPVIFNVGLLVEPKPEFFPAESGMFKAIDARLQSSSSAPVLLAIEYQPGLSGEMRLAAEALVAQLVAKKARIVLISTVPAGPALGQQLLDNVSKDYPQQVNLGYLPGGTISLVSFAKQPRLAAPATLDNQPAWGTDSLLKDVKNLQDFSQVIVLTDRAEVGRTWVEQIQPQLGSVPLFVVASMQAAPLLQPYVDSGQIAGMTSGLLGGAMYAQLTKQEFSQAFSYLSAYQVGVLLAFAFVLVGGVISGGVSLFKRSDREEE